MGEEGGGCVSGVVVWEGEQDFGGMEHLLKDDGAPPHKAPPHKTKVYMLPWTFTCVVGKGCGLEYSQYSKYGT